MVEIVKPVYLSNASIISGLGNTLEQHWQACLSKKNAFQKFHYAADKKTVFASYPTNTLATDESKALHLTAFETLAFTSAKQSLATAEISLKDTAFVLSTTKGNIELLGNLPTAEMRLHPSAKKIAGALGIPAENVFVISQACVSGVVALQYAQWLLDADRFKHVLVCGCDRLSAFVVQGFLSFQAIADEPCRPFDSQRTGINIGEAAASILVQKEKQPNAVAKLSSAATSNDANHISGPSRTGLELAKAITDCMQIAGVNPSEVHMISSHGTATLYNDEMEAKALQHAGLQAVPVHSFKSYVGHTLGAAGVLETAICMLAMEKQVLIPSLQFTELGVSAPLNICTESTKATIKNIIKTASGFGGTNAALLLQKI